MSTAEPDPVTVPLSDELESQVYALFFDGGPDREREFAQLAAAHPSAAPAMAALWRRLDVGSGAIGRGAPGAADPDTIGPYRIVRRLGEGGFGVVYLAEQCAPIARLVAVKQLSARGVTGQVVRRFLVERQALARLNHPNIATAIDAGTDADGRPYLVMEYVDGAPIDVYCDRERATVEQRLRLFLDVLDGVQHAHHKALLHRDLKPSNVLVTCIDGRVLPKIIDFGIVRLLENDLAPPFDAADARTAEGHFVGTPEYVSPEQASGLSAGLDTRSDVYALGVMLYQLLAGVLPVDRSELLRAGLRGIATRLRDRPTPALARRFVELDPACAARAADARRSSPAALADRLRGDLEAIVRKATRFHADERYASAAEFAADIRDHLADRAIRARPPTAYDELARFVRRHRVAVSVVVTLLVVLSIALVVALDLYRRADHERALAELRTYESRISAADYALRFHNAVAAVDRLDACPVELRGFEWRYLRNRADHCRALDDGLEGYWRRGAALAADGAVVAGVDFERRLLELRKVAFDGSVRWRRESPDMPESSIARSGFTAVRVGATVEVFDPDGGVRHRVPISTAEACFLHLTPDVASLLFLSDGGALQLVECATGRVVVAGDAGIDANGRLLAIREDGLRLLLRARGNNRAAFADRGAEVWTLGDGTATRRLLDFDEFVACGEFLPDDLLALGTSRGVSIVEIASQRVVREFAANGGQGVASLAVLPRDRLATGGVDTAIEIWDWRTGVRERVLLGAPSRIDRLTASPDGDALLAISHRSGHHRFDVDAPTGHTRLVGHTMGVTDLVWSADGERLCSASEDGTVRSFDWRAGVQVGAIDLGTDVNGLVVHAPSERLFAIVGSRRLVALDARELAPLASLDLEVDGIWRIAVDPSGRWLAVAAREHGLQIVDLATFRVARSDRRGERDCRAVAFSPDGRELWVAWFDFHAREGQLTAHAVGSSWDERVAVPCAGICQRIGFPRDEADSMFLAMSHYRSQGAGLERRRRDDGALLSQLVAHTSGVMALDVEPDGTRVVTGSRDGTARLWFVPTGSDVLILDHGGEDWLTAAAFHPRGEVLATAGEAGSIHLWHARTRDGSRSERPAPGVRGAR